MKKLLIFALIMLLGSTAWAVDTKISALNASTTLTTDDLMVTVDDPGGAGIETKKVTWANTMNSIGNVTGSLVTGFLKVTTATGALSSTTNIATTDFASANISQWTNDTGFITSKTTKILEVGGLGTLGTVSGNTVSGNMVSGERFYANTSVGSGTVTANTVSANTLSVAGAYTFPGGDGTSGYTLKTNGSGTVTWQADTDTTYTLDSLGGYSTTKTLQVGGIGATNISGNTVSGNTVLGGRIYGNTSVWGNTITGNTISGNLVTIDKISNLATNGFVKTSATNGTLSVDTATYLTTESDTLDSVVTRGQTTRVAVVGGLGTSGTVSAGTVSGNVVRGERVYGNTSVGGQTVTGNTVSANTLNIAGAFTFPTTDGSINQVLKTSGGGVLTWQAEAGGASSLDSLIGYSTANVLQVGGLGTTGTVSGGTVKNTINTLPNYSTIQFTIASPSTLSEQSKLLLWDNESGNTFNVYSISAWSTTTYNVVMFKMNSDGSYGGGLCDFNTLQTANRLVTTNTVTVVSSSTITANTVLYLTPASTVVNYVKISMKGYWS